MNTLNTKLKFQEFGFKKHKNVLIFTTEVYRAPYAVLWVEICVNKNNKGFFVQNIKVLEKNYDVLYDYLTLILEKDSIYPVAEEVHLRVEEIINKLGLIGIECNIPF